jgi:serine/threonine protein kinase
MGAQGPVFRAQDTVAGQIVAIKAFKLDVSPELAPSIAEALRALVGQAPSVEGLVPLIDAGLEGDTPWLAMEHLSCPTLDTRLRDVGLLPLEEATALVRALADAVDTAHAHGLDHGSLHPRDVFLPEGGGVVVSGFGVAAAVGVAGLRPPRRRPFTAPETLAQKPLDAPADRYALGVIAYEVVSGRRLLGAGDDLAAGLAARAETSDIPRAATALAAMLAERPEHRPSTATAFAQALCAALESPASPASPLTAVMPPPGRPPRPAEEPPTSEALAEFARQGTFWEPPRRGVDDPDATTVVAGPPPRPVEDTPTVAVVPLPAFLEPQAEVVSEPIPESMPEPDLGSDPGPDPTLIHETVRLDPPLRVEPAGRDAGDAMLFRTFGDVPERTPPPAPVQEQAAHTPPLVVLALTLGLGLAVGAAGGYLVGHRSGERAAQRELGGETGTTSATYGDTAPSTPAGPDAAAPPTDASGASPRPAPAGPPSGPQTSTPAATGQPPPAASVAPATPRGRPAPAVAATGQLVVRSTPTRAGVMVDGVWRGRSPITVRGLSVGTHSVRVVEDGYVSETRRVAVDARAAGTTVSFQLSRVRGPERPAAAVSRPGAKTGALRVESRPSGAAVLIDGRVVGTTPLLISDLEPGQHQVRLELPGHRPWATTATIVAGQSVRVAASLEETER